VDKSKHAVTDYLFCHPCTVTRSSPRSVQPSHNIAPNKIMARVSKYDYDQKMTNNHHKSRKLNKQYIAILDSGTTATMSGVYKAFSELHLFTNQERARRHVIFGDGSSHRNVNGIGTMDIVTENKRLIFKNVL